MPGSFLKKMEPSLNRLDVMLDILMEELSIIMDIAQSSHGLMMKITSRLLVKIMDLSLKNITKRLCLI